MQEVPKLEVITTDDHTPVRCFLSEDKGSYVPYHYHPALEIIYVLQGSMQFAVMGDTAKRLEFLASEANLKSHSAEQRSEHAADVDFRIVKLPECSSIPALDAFTLRKVFGKAPQANNEQEAANATPSSYPSNLANVPSSDSKRFSPSNFDYDSSLNSNSASTLNANSARAYPSKSDSLSQELATLRTEQENIKDKQGESNDFGFKTNVDFAPRSNAESKAIETEHLHSIYDSDYSNDSNDANGSNDSYNSDDSNDANAQYVQDVPNDESRQTTEVELNALTAAYNVDVQDTSHYSIATEKQGACLGQQTSRNLQHQETLINKASSSASLDRGSTYKDADKNSLNSKSHQGCAKDSYQQERAHCVESQGAERLGNSLRNRQEMPLESSLEHNRINLVYISTLKAKGTFNSPKGSVWSSDHLSRTLSSSMDAQLQNTSIVSQSSNSKVNTVNLKSEDEQVTKEGEVGKKLSNKYGVSSLEELAYGSAHSKRYKQAKQNAKLVGNLEQYNADHLSKSKDKQDHLQKVVVDIPSQSLVSNKSALSNSSEACSQSVISNQSAHSSQSVFSNQFVGTSPSVNSNQSDNSIQSTSLSSSAQETKNHQNTAQDGVETHSLFNIGEVDAQTFNASAHSERIHISRLADHIAEKTQLKASSIASTQQIRTALIQPTEQEEIAHLKSSDSVWSASQSSYTNQVTAANQVTTAKQVRAVDQVTAADQEQFFMHNSYKSALTFPAKLQGKDQAMGSEYVQLESGQANCVLFNFDELHTTRCQNYNCSLVLQIPKEFLLESLGLEPTDSLYFVLSLASPQCLQRMQTALAKMAVLTLSGTSKQAIEGKEIRFKQALYSFLECLLEVKVNTAPLLQTESADLKMRSRIYPILDMLNSQYMQDISLNQVAELLHVHPNYFCRIFKQVVGQSFYAYLTELRLCHIYQDLINSNDSLEDVVRRNGINLNTYFFSQFKRRFGITTSDLRKRYNSTLQNKNELA